ncbi:MAG: FMN-binding protein [Clostridiaceae bacterium]|nr:FMN-binding protein [Clostridiaceae bacterium]
MKTVKKRKGNIKVWTVLLVILGVIVAGSGITMLAFEPGRREASNLTIGNVDFKKLRDGVYEGEYKGTKDHFRDAKVMVTVDSGAVTDIKVTGGALSGEKQTSEVRNGQSIDDLLDRVIDSQSLQVDVISGATISSKVHLKAVENALKTGK